MAQIVYKKGANDSIIVLEIPADAKTGTILVIHYMRCIAVTKCMLKEYIINLQEKR